jgi:hypothetical protein
MGLPESGRGIETVLKGIGGRPITSTLSQAVGFGVPTERTTKGRQQRAGDTPHLLGRSAPESPRGDGRPCRPDRVFAELRCQLREGSQQARCINGPALGWLHIRQQRKKTGQAVSGIRHSACSLLRDSLEFRLIAIPSGPAGVRSFTGGVEVEPLRLLDGAMHCSRTDRPCAAAQEARNILQESIAAVERDRHRGLEDVAQFVVCHYERLWLHVVFLEIARRKAARNGGLHCSED